MIHTILLYSARRYIFKKRGVFCLFYTIFSDAVRQFYLGATLLPIYALAHIKKKHSHNEQFIVYDFEKLQNSYSKVIYNVETNAVGAVYNL